MDFKCDFIYLSMRYLFKLMASSRPLISLQPTFDNHIRIMSWQRPIGDRFIFLIWGLFTVRLPGKRLLISLTLQIEYGKAQEFYLVKGMAKTEPLT